ncbi:class I SAM-dependent methyltransferase [Actinoplanes sp. NPDC051859]|uniref:class I SAM-dependent methyltransferase n=1 Tax=Actinoplanes sp. NPDC051859 TaxID=3363909 RepID=UPI0037963202
MGSQSIRERVVDRDDSWGGRRRARRWEWLVRAFPDLDQMTVIDLGGDAGTWTQSPLHPKHVHVVNIDTPPAEVPDWITAETGDACALPDRIAANTYDLVFSNSVIEHVGGHERRLRFAESVHRLAPAHWVQTPYRYFPVEPHWIAPGMQFLPVRARAVFARRWPLAHVRSANLREALTGVLWTELLDRSQMRYYFPDAELLSERIAGLTKSLIAVKKG